MKIIVASNHCPGSLLIKIGTMSRWCHAAVLLDGDWVVDATLGAGVTLQSLSEFRKHFPVIEVIDIPLPDAVRFLNAQMGKPYDWTALFGMVMQRDWQEDDSWFCSELVEATLAAGGRKRFRDAVSRITPQQTWAVL